MQGTNGVLLCALYFNRETSVMRCKVDYLRLSFLNTSGVTNVCELGSVLLTAHSTSVQLLAAGRILMVTT
jgi:hypothetical protein